MDRLFQQLTLLLAAYFYAKQQFLWAQARQLSCGLMASTSAVYRVTSARPALSQWSGSDGDGFPRLTDRRPDLSGTGRAALHLPRAGMAQRRDAAPGRQVVAQPCRQQRDAVEPGERGELGSGHRRRPLVRCRPVLCELELHRGDV